MEVYQSEKGQFRLIDTIDSQSQSKKHIYVYTHRIKVIVFFLCVGSVFRERSLNYGFRDYIWLCNNRFSF